MFKCPGCGATAPTRCKCAQYGRSKTPKQEATPKPLAHTCKADLDTPCVACTAEEKVMLMEDKLKKMVVSAECLMDDIINIKRELQEFGRWIT